VIQVQYHKNHKTIRASAHRPEENVGHGDARVRWHAKVRQALDHRQRQQALRQEARAKSARQTPCCQDNDDGARGGEQAHHDMVVHGV